MAFLFCSHSCDGNAQKQGTEFEGQMKRTGDLERAREGRDINQCRGSCLHKTHYIGVATRDKLMCIIIWHAKSVLKTSGLVIHKCQTKWR